MPMRTLLSSALEILGLVALTVGLGLVWLPLGVIFGGLALVVIGISL
jgi:hypothetical protein